MNINKDISISSLFNQIKQLVKFIRLKIKPLILGVIVSASLGVTYSFIKKPTYSSHLSFLVNENQSPSLNLSSLAGMAGIGNIGGGSISEDKLVFLATSRYILSTTLLSKISINSKETSLANLYIDVYKMENGFKADTALKGFTYFKNNSIDSLTYQENKVMGIIVKHIEDTKSLKVESKKKSGIVSQSSGIITVDYHSKNEDLSKYFLDLLYSNLSKHYIEKSIQRQLKNYRLIKKRADSLSDLLFDRENDGAKLVDENLNIAKMSGRLKIERTRRESELLFLMHSEVLKNLEVAKFNLESQTPALQLIDSPIFPLKVEHPSAIKFGLLASVLGFIVTLCSLLIAHFLKHDSL